MIEVQPPHDYSGHLYKRPSVFLGGTIDMGQSHDWQADIVAVLQKMDVLLLNPRRKNWDSSWKQSKDNPQFRQQVEWELKALDDADIVVFYFAPGSQSPITLMELGLHAAEAPEKVLVCCPEGFWRKGNVDIVCERYDVRQAETMPELIEMLKGEIQAISLVSTALGE
jgi:hypothetical protein